MLRKTLKILSLVGLVLTLWLWQLSATGGYGHTWFSETCAGEQESITFICFDGGLGWDTSTNMSQAEPNPEHSISLWIPTVVFPLISVLLLLPNRYRRVAGKTITSPFVLGRLVLRKPVAALFILLLLASAGLWGASYHVFPDNDEYDYFLAMTHGVKPMPPLSRVSKTSGPHIVHELGREMVLILLADSGQAYIYFISGAVNNPPSVKELEQRAGPIRFTRKDISFVASGSTRGYFKVWNVSFPFWLSTTCFLIHPTFFLRGLYRGHRRKQLRLCIKCGYSLRGLTDPRCPECGMPFQKKALEESE